MAAVGVPVSIALLDAGKVAEARLNCLANARRHLVGSRDAGP